MRSTKLSLTAARNILRAHSDLASLHRRGHRWVEAFFVKALSRLATREPRSDRRLAASGYLTLGRLHDLNGVPRAAMRAFDRGLRLAPDEPLLWRGLGAMFEAMGSYERARHAFGRALRLAPADELLRADRERADWAMLGGCPVLYAADSPSWNAMEALAAGDPEAGLAILGRRRSDAVRRARARILAVQGDVEGVVAEWRALVEQAPRVALQHADWYYTFDGEVAEDAGFWRLMLWQVRRRLDGGILVMSPTLERIDLPELKRFELYLRYQLARCERDLPALLALAGKYPAWREPGEAALLLA